jgi:hypothetical protein
MNLDFMRLGTTRWEVTPAQPDYHRLVAALVAAQGTTRTAVLEARLGAPRARCDTPIEALGTLFEALAGWESAVLALGGSFHPAVARAHAPKQDDPG